MSARINRKTATHDEKGHIVRAMQRSASNYAEANGFFFADELVNSDGCHVDLFVPPGTPSDAIERARKEVRGMRDVVSFSAVECPADWFDEIDMPRQRTIEELLWAGERPSVLVKHVGRISSDEERVEAIDTLMEGLQGQSERHYLAFELAHKGLVPDACMGHVRNIVMREGDERTVAQWDAWIEPTLSTWTIKNADGDVIDTFYSEAEAKTAITGIHIERNDPDAKTDPLAQAATHQSPLMSGR